MNYLPEWEASRAIVIDANIAVNAIIPIEVAPIYLACFAKWQDERAAIYAPAFWLAEAASAIRQYVYRKAITSSEAHSVVRRIFALQVEVVPLDEELCQHALDWAAKIQHSKIYDSLYLALAERLRAEFWTADKKLADAARAAGARWAHFAGET